MKYSLLASTCIFSLLSSTHAQLSPTEQCVLNHGPRPDSLDAPVLLERKQPTEQQIKGGLMRTIGFSNTQGNLNARMTTLYSQDGQDHLSYLYLDGTPLNVAFVYFQFDYYDFKNQPITELWKVNSDGDCIVFIEGAELDTSIVPLDKIVAQVYYTSGEPTMNNKLSHP